MRARKSYCAGRRTDGLPGTQTGEDLDARLAAPARQTYTSLCTELRNANAGPSGLDPGMIEGETPLVASGHQIVPTGLARFPKAERVFVVDPVSGALKADGGPAVNVAPYIRPGNPVIPVASIVPTAQLAPGAYQLDILASHSSGHEQVLRSVAFDLTQ